MIISNTLLMSGAPLILTIVISVIVSLGIGAGAGFVLNKFLYGKKIEGSKAQANKILEDAYAQAKNIKQQAQGNRKIERLSNKTKTAAFRHKPRIRIPAYTETIEIRPR